jgi:hypothetical protein
MRSGARALAWGAGGLLALFVGCRTAAANRPAPESSLNGRASYEAVLEPASGTSELVAQREYIPAIPVGDNHVPAYPEQLVGLNLPPQKIVLRLVLDERGDIVAIRPSEIPSEADARYPNEFEAAIGKAIENWRFSPAKRRTFVDAPENSSGKPPYKVLKSELPVRTYFDIRFIFEVHDGKGVVRGAP